MQTNNEKDLEEDFYYQYRTYLQLENDLMEFLEIYKEKKSNELLYILTRIHVNCVHQLENFLSFSTHFFKGEMRKRYETTMREKLEFMREIAVEIKNFRQSKQENSENNEISRQFK